MKPISFQNGQGLTLRGFIHTPTIQTNKKGTAPIYETAIIFLHGFPSNCLGFSSTRMAKVMKKSKSSNYLFLTFSFSHSPPSDGKFEDKLMSKEAEDIKYAINFLQKNYPFKQLILMGISTGAIDASLYAYRDKRISKLILMGAESDTKHSVRYDFTDQQVHDFWAKGYIVYNRPDHWVHKKKLKKAFYDEFFTLDISQAIKRYKRPLLIIHGENDEAVPLKEAKGLLKMANRPKKLVIIKGADHRFSKPGDFRKVVKVINEFVKKR